MLGALGFVYALPLLRPNIIPLYMDVAVHLEKGLDIGKTIAREVKKNNPKFKELLNSTIYIEAVLFLFFLLLCFVFLL